MLATNTISQGDSREVGLDQITAQGARIFRAMSSQKWPGDASLEVSCVWSYNGEWSAKSVLDGKITSGITSFLKKTWYCIWQTPFPCR
jgi:hypothetical protein